MHSTPPMNNRRTFLQSGTAAAISAATHAFAAPSDGEIKIAMIGCGGRGTGACNQALTAGSTIKLVALLDPLEGKAQAALDILKKAHEGQVDVPPDQIFTEFEDYKKVFQLADVVLITTPPGPRPFLFEQAIKAGKHVFMEKPVASDAAGVRRVLATAEEARKKNLNVCVGLQRRYQPEYIKMVKRIQDGEIGDLVYGRVYWNGTARAGAERMEGESEMHYQIRNWYFFTWMSGDHILEQHVHNLDVANWVLNGKMPVRAVGQGGRQVRKGKIHGTIFDHHTVEFEYENGFRLLSQCCQIGGKCARSVSEHFHGTKGVADLDGGGRFALNGAVVADRTRVKGKGPGGKRTTIIEDPYQLEHDQFFENIRTGKLRVDAEYGAYSTLMGLMGRMASYTGQVITSDQALNSKDVLCPDNITWNTDPPVKPDADGWYPVAEPGTTMPV